MKRISGLGYLKELNYDLGLRLENTNNAEEVFKWLKKRLKILEGKHPWIVIDWESAGCTKNNFFNPVDNDLDELDLFNSGLSGEDAMKINIDLKFDINGKELKK